MKVEVAPLGPAKGLTLAISSEDLFGPDLAWAERPVFPATVAPSTRLAEVLDAAARHFGVTVDPGEGGQTVSEAVGRVVFDRGLTGLDLQLTGYERFRVVDQDGLLRWDRKISDVTFVELEAARSMRLIDGQIDRIFLCLQTPQGGSSPEDWKAFIEFIQWFWVVFVTLPNVEASVHSAGRLLQVVQKKWVDWLGRGAGPAELLDTVEDLDADSASPVLGITTDEAESIRQGVGLEGPGDAPATAASVTLANITKLLALLTEVGLSPTEPGPINLNRLMTSTARQDRILSREELSQTLAEAFRRG